jgi:hypothetical protein
VPGAGDETVAVRWQAAIAITATTIETAREKLDVISGSRL